MGRRIVWCGIGAITVFCFFLAAQAMATSVQSEKEVALLLELSDTASVADTLAQAREQVV